MTTPKDVVRRRLHQRERLVERARGFATGLERDLDVRGVAVFGSVARGDFGHDSDVDVLVIAGGLTPDPMERMRALGDVPPRLEPVVWTPDEFRGFLDRRNAIAVEAADEGIWLIGSVEAALRGAQA